jgi:pyrroline-5-carboxylate reductase
MASAIIQGLLRQGAAAPDTIAVVEPWQEARDQLRTRFGILAQSAPGPFLARAGTVVWAVKPQTFKDAAVPVAAHTGSALHLSVAAGIPSDSIARWLGNEQVVRAMPNTPALIGKGITALYARAGIDALQKQGVEQIIRSTGDLLWVDSEDQLDAVTALSGSGPAYVFYLPRSHDRGRPANGPDPRAVLPAWPWATFAGASELARSLGRPARRCCASASRPRAAPRYAAIASMEQDNLKNAFMRALQAARHRARELGDEFGS